ncbi:MAG: tRNA-dihydrouridine synthase family protein [Prolixibacteraceae bacterium]|nr:tRNA-dihydrouridine synthase family protein [Prolixibacteraceae bacterium]
MQGFTDAVYRKAYNEVFSGIDAFFIPYISVKNNELIKKYAKEILRINNQQERAVPQVLAANTNELLYLADLLVRQGYTEINLNMGCPYPMVTNRGQGAGLLPDPDKIRVMLEVFFRNFDVSLSVKMRAGLNSTKEIENVIPVLNDFPLSEIIVHPRVAKQLYSGTIAIDAFDFATQNTRHTLVFNGDILSVSDFEKIKKSWPAIRHFMLGRGVLQNPFLPVEIKNQQLSADERKLKLIEFHQRILEYYTEWMDNEGNVLNKMKQFWIYFENNFSNEKKLMKRITKIRSLTNYKAEINVILQRRV